MRRMQKNRKRKNAAHVYIENQLKSSIVEHKLLPVKTNKQKHLEMGPSFFLYITKTHFWENF